MTYAAHVMAWRGPSCPPLVSTRVGHRVCRGRLLESNARLSRQQRAFASDASSTAPDHAVPVMHLLTSYDLDTAPEVRVTPLKLQGPGSDASLGAKLWREVRLAREVRSKGGGGIGNGTELFARAPAGWGDGVVVRVGAAGPVTNAVKDTLGRDGFTLTEQAPKPLSRTDDDEKELYEIVLREAMYNHCANALTNFNVSRTAKGVVFTEEESFRGEGGLGSSDRHAKFEVEVDTGSSDDETMKLRVATSISNTSTLSVRQVLDGLNGGNQHELHNVPVVALGGPRLEGTLLLSGYDGGVPDAGDIGSPRSELNGVSLLQYHCDRYPARVELLKDADPNAKAVWLTPKGPKKTFGQFGGPMAYQAELLAVKHANKFSEVGDTKNMSPTVLNASLTQSLVTNLRSKLGQPFLETLQVALSDKMTRLPDPVLVSSGPCGKIVGMGAIASGPAVAPCSNEKLEKENSKALPKLMLIKSVTSDESQLKNRLITGITSAHEAWSVPSDATRDTVRDVNEAVVERFPESDKKNKLQSLFKKAQRDGFDLVLVETSGVNDEVSTRDAANAMNAPYPRRCLFNTDARELALELGAQRGGQASTFPGFATVKKNLLLDPVPGDNDLVVFVGVAGILGLAYRNGERPEECVVTVVDQDAAVLFDGTRERRVARRGGQTNNNDKSDEPTTADDQTFASASLAAGIACVDKAVRVLGKGPHRLVVHHEGQSHAQFLQGVLAASKKHSEIKQIDVLDVEREPSSVTGRILRWDKQSGVTRPDKGLTWRVSDDQSIAVTAGDTVSYGQRNVTSNDTNYLTRPLFLKRVCGSTYTLTLAREVVALADTRVNGFGGTHAMPVTLRGGGLQTRIVLV